VICTSGNGMITIDALVYAKAHGGWSLEKEARGQPLHPADSHSDRRLANQTSLAVALISNSKDQSPLRTQAISFRLLHLSGLRQRRRRTWRRQGPSRRKRKVGGSADLSSSQRKIDSVPDLLLPRLPTRDKQRLAAITRSSLVARSYSFGRTSASPASVKNRDRDVTVNQFSQTVQPGLCMSGLLSPLLFSPGTVFDAFPNQGHSARLLAA